MRHIRVKNFGPIREGFGEESGWMTIPKVTFFIGDNGTGKSTVAKLISTFSWLEKALVLHRLSEKELSRLKTMQRYCRYHKMESFFDANTELDYEGNAYRFSYREERLTITKIEDEGRRYRIPKIMYVGSERNFLSVAANPGKIKGLPESLGTFLDEFQLALDKLSGRVDLPVGDVTLSYQKQNRIVYVHGKSSEYSLRLTEASSGIQSATPLFIVSQYLSKLMEEDSDGFIRKRSSDEEKKLRLEMARILKNPKLSEDFKMSALELLDENYNASAFQNIVEEPEQNLFPDSQRAMLNALLGFVNKSIGNELIVTTHSPYLISYLSLAMKAAQLDLGLFYKHKDEGGVELHNALDKIVPIASIVKATDVAIYEVTNSGSILLLDQPNGIPVDNHYLNDRLMSMNGMFAELLEIEMQMEEWQ